MHELVLAGIEGINPLGFLAAIGALKVLDDKWPGLVSLSWIRTSAHLPVIRFPGADERLSQQKRQHCLAATIADTLAVPKPRVSQSAAKEVQGLHKKCLEATERLKESERELKKLRNELMREGRKLGIQGEALRSWVSDRISDLQSKIYILREDLKSRRARWLRKLGEVVPAQELRLGKTLSIMPIEYRVAAISARESCSYHLDRRQVDFMGAFAAETVKNREQVEPTPFCFISGSGHQYFLDTIAKLMEVVDSGRIEKCLFHPWSLDDERLSLRWAPAEDRRYALMWDDPGGQETKTIWAANLLAYNALRLLPVADVSGRLMTSGFAEIAGRRFFSWPIWQGFLAVDTIKSLLSLGTLRQSKPDQTRLERMGVSEVYRCERVQIGKPPNVKLNFGISFPAGSGDDARL